MNCFKSIATQEQTIQKSRFIGYTFMGETKHDILRTLQSIAKEHPHGSHLAFVPYNPLLKNIPMEVI